MVLKRKSLAELHREELHAEAVARPTLAPPAPAFTTPQEK